MKSKIFRAGIVGAVALSAVCFTSPPASAAPAAGAENVISICAGNSLSMSDPAGHRLSQDALHLAILQVQQVCAGDSEQTEPSPLLGYANVVAFINTSPGRIVFGGYANSVPYGSSKPRNELSCIYHEQPFDGHANTWSSCGYGVGTTSISTSTMSFCPVPGTRWESMVSLYANRVHKQDAWAAAIGI